MLYSKRFILILWAVFGNTLMLPAQNVLDLAGLNENATTSVAYSVRKLSSAYLGNCMKVRRNSDNSMQDIGFTTAGELDQSALLTFVGASGNGFVVTWYDQSGNNNHLTQASVSNQPRIVNAGVVDIESGKPFIRFFGVISGNNNSLNLTSSLNTNGFVSVINKFAVGGDGFILGHRSAYYWHSNYSTGKLIEVSFASSSIQNAQFWQNGLSVPISEAVFNTSLMINSIAPSDASSLTSWDNIGTDRNTLHNLTGGGGYSEIIVLTSTVNIFSRNNLIQNQGDFFGITITPVTYLNRYGQFVQNVLGIVNRNGGLGSSGILSNGESISRTALTSPPATRNISSISSYSAQSGGTISSDNGAIIKAGVCWSTSPSPTINNSKTVDLGVAGTYTSYLNNLRGGTTYYVRAYATNNLGTQYGSEISFSTANSVSPVFSGNNTVTSIKSTSANISVNLNADGGEPILQKGFCWSTNPNPTITDSTTLSGDISLGLYAANLNNLTLATKYYVRPYATNSIGITYGPETSFTTLSYLSVGDNYQGGIIFYILTNADNGFISGETHGLIAAPVDAGPTTALGTLFSSYLGTDTLVGLGKSNTEKINSYIGLSTTRAAALCSSQTTGGYTDWYLPSKNELNKMFQSKSFLSNFRSNTNYWSSSQSSTNTRIFWAQNFDTGFETTSDSRLSRGVRHIRSF